MLVGASDAPARYDFTKMFLEVTCEIPRVALTAPID